MEVPGHTHSLAEIKGHAEFPGKGGRPTGMANDPFLEHRDRAVLAACGHTRNLSSADGHRGQERNCTFIPPSMKGAGKRWGR